MPFSPRYPLFLSLQGMPCLVAGLGEVGRRKLEMLLACGADTVLALDPDMSELPALSCAAQGCVRLERRACTPEDVAASRLVYAATGSGAENARIAALCREHGVLCNCADAPEKGDFVVPALAVSGDLRVALSTGGASPALARQLRRELEGWLEPHAALARLLGLLRPIILARGQGARRNRELFRALVASPLGSWLAAGNLAACRRWLDAHCEPELAGEVSAVLERAVCPEPAAQNRGAREAGTPDQGTRNPVPDTSTLSTGPVRCAPHQPEMP